MYVVTVTFEVHPEWVEAFASLMRLQAQNSLELESGCLRFDVCFSENGQNTIFLYEIYADRAAFDLHLASDHFKQFDAAVVSMIAAKTVNTWTLDGDAP
ncbi:MAG: hypothetical protein Hens3KO_13650 [Henriciella sp.]